MAWQERAGSSMPRVSDDKKDLENGSLAAAAKAGV
jgi:hypothetical protein